MSSVQGAGAGAGAGAGSGSGTSSDSDHEHVIDVVTVHPSETAASGPATGAAAGTSEDIVGDPAAAVPAPLASELPCPPPEPFPDAVPVRLARDPEALECPYEACAYDCQRHHPVRSPCCNRLMCFKCAGVLATLPNATPCTLCGKAASGPFEASQFQRDVGLLLALASNVPPPDREECFDCKRDDALEPALFWCVDASCGCDGQRPLCSEHADIHRLKRSHVVVRRTHELGIPADRLPGVTTCDKEGHGGPLAFACKTDATCGLLLCPTCVPLHPHFVEPMDSAGARAVPELKSALATLEALRVTASDAASQARSDLRRLHQRRADALANLRTLYDAQVVEVNRVFQEKEAALLALLTKARAVAGEAATAAAACDLALASPDPLTHVAASRSVQLSLSKCDPSIGFARIDSTLEVVLNLRPGGTSFQTPNFMTTWETSSNCTLEWDCRDEVRPGQEVSLVLKLNDHNGRPCSEVELQAIQLHLSKSGVALRVPDISTLTVSRVTRTPGVFKAVFVAPSSAEAIDGMVLSASVTICGRAVATSSTRRIPSSRRVLAWDPAAGSLRTMSPDGWLTATTRATNNSCFRGRTGLCRPGSSKLNLQLEVVTGPAAQNLTIAIGSTGAFEGSTWDFSQNPSFPFFYEVYYGAVNATPYHSNTGQLRAISPNTTYTFVFNVKDHKLTFAAGASGGPLGGPQLQPQPGEWELPDTFYLLIGCDHGGYKFRVSYV